MDLNIDMELLTDIIEIWSSAFYKNYTDTKNYYTI